MQALGICSSLPVPAAGAGLAVAGCNLGTSPVEGRSLCNSRGHIGHPQQCIRACGIWWASHIRCQLGAFAGKAANSKCAKVCRLTAPVHGGSSRCNQPTMSLHWLPIHTGDTVYCYMSTGPQVSPRRTEYNCTAAAVAAAAAAVVAMPGPLLLRSPAACIHHNVHYLLVQHKAHDRHTVLPSHSLLFTAAGLQRGRLLQ